MTVWSSRSVRVLAVLAAACFVLAFALATALPPHTTLAQLVLRWNPDAVAAAEGVMLAGGAGWFWRHVALPMLGRPCWLLPVDAGVVLGGVAVTVALRRARQAERRRG